MWRSAIALIHEEQTTSQALIRKSLRPQWEYRKLHIGDIGYAAAGEIPKSISDAQKGRQYHADSMREVHDNIFSEKHNII